MTVAVAPSLPALSSFQQTTMSRGAVGTLEGRTIGQVLVDSIDTTARVMRTFDGIDYSSKFFGGICLAIQIWFNDMALPIISEMGRTFREVTSVCGALTIFNRINVFTSGDYKKDSIYKNIYVMCLVFKSTCDSLKWLAVLGVIKLADIARAIGGSPLVRLTSKVAIGTVANAFCIVGCLFDITDSALKIHKGKATLKSYVTIANDLGKIGCCALGFMFFSYTFAAVSIFTGATSLWKTVISAQEKQYALVVSRR